MSWVQEKPFQAMRRTSERLKSKREKQKDPDQGSEEFIQNQIILAPEIMSMILNQLDLQALKKVRLVCKSWLLEAQFHMGRRGIVYLDSMEGSSGSWCLPDFIDTMKNKILALPQPFLSIDLDLGYSNKPVPPSTVRRQLSKVGPPLQITRFSTRCLALKHVLSLIIQCSSSLEYLKLFASESDEECRRIISRKNPDVKLAALRHLELQTEVENGDESNFAEFPTIVAWIMEVSPNVDTFETWMESGNFAELPNEILLRVGIENVKTLILGGFELTRAASEYLVSVPFRKLQNLKIPDDTEPERQALVAIARRSATTLKSMDLTESRNLLLDGDVDEEFPVCLNVQVLELWLFPGWSDFVSRCFPSIQVFTARVSHLHCHKNILPGSHSFDGVKNLRLHLGSESSKYSPGSFWPIKLWKTFPALECLKIDEPFLLECSRMKAKSGSQLLQAPDGLKHLVICGISRNLFTRARCAGFSSLAEFRGIETLALEKFSHLSRIPVQEMPGLKVIRFPWGDCPSLKLKQLLQIARGIAKVAITNCCSVLSLNKSESKDLLKAFLDAAPNAVCGCRQEEEMWKPFG